MAYALAVIRLEVEEYELIPANINRLISNPPAEDEEAIILDIGPCNPEEASAIAILLDDNPQIRFWLDYSPWPKGLREYVNRDRLILTVYSDPSCFRNIELLGYTKGFSCVTSHNLARLADSLEGDKEEWKSDPQTLRLKQAHQVTDVLYENTGNQDLWKIFFDSTTTEIIFGEKNEKIDELSQRFGTMERLANEAMNKVRRNPLLSSGEKIVGYVDCGEIDDCFDLKAVVHYGLSRYPWLMVAHYFYHGKDYTNIYSKELSLAKMLGPEGKVLKMPMGEALRKIHAEISNW